MTTPPILLAILAALLGGCEAHPPSADDLAVTQTTPIDRYGVVCYRYITSRELSCVQVHKPETQ